MLETQERLENRSSHQELLLGGLIGIGVGAHGNRCALIARLAKLFLEQTSGVGLVEDARFEIDPG